VAVHDYVISNGTGAAVRSDLNGALAAIVSQNSSATEPSPTYAYQRWADTTAGVMKMRNGANSAWISLYQLDGEWSTIAFENGTAAAPSIYFKDSGTDTGIYSPGADQVAISTGGTGRLFVTSAGLVGIGTSSPTENLTIYGASSRLAVTGGSGSSAILIGNQNSGGANNPSVIEAANGSLYFGGGSSWSGGGTFNYTMTLLDGGNVGIGTTSPATILHCATANGTASQIQLTQQFQREYRLGIPAGGTNFEIYDVSAGSSRLNIDSSGRLLVGTSTSRTGGLLQVETVGNNATRVHGFITNSGDSVSPVLKFVKTRGTSVGAVTAVQNGDDLGYIAFSGTDGTNVLDGAYIAAIVDGTPGASDLPSRLVFSTTADGAASPTERMRIGSDGNVGIGGAASAASLLHLAGGGTGARGALRISDTGGGNYWEIGRDNNISGDFTFSLLSSEKVRIDTNGIFIVGATTNGGAGGLSIYPIGSGAGSAAIGVWNKTNTAAEGAAQFRVSGTTVGSITYSNVLVAYNTTSDYRLKENVTSIPDGIARCKQLKPSRFNFKVDPDHTVEGFIAHEAQAVVPECVTGTKDAVDADGNPVYQGIDQSKLVPLLTAALQEAIAKIEALETRLSALEGK
jgi:hypothetical protein